MTITSIEIIKGAGAASIPGPRGEKGDKGDKGDSGVMGPPGASGRTIWSGTTDPHYIPGQTNGDFYLQFVTDDTLLFGPLLNDNWGTGISLTGPAGPQGIQGIQGIQGPPGDVSNLDTARGWTTVQYQALTTLTYTAGGTTAWDVAAKPNTKMAISGGNTTMGAPTNVVEGAYYAMRTVNDSTPRTFTWNAAYKWPGGSSNAQQPTASAGAVDRWWWCGGAGNTLEFVGMQRDVR